MSEPFMPAYTANKYPVCAGLAAVSPCARIVIGMYLETGMPAVTSQMLYKTLQCFSGVLLCGRSCCDTLQYVSSSEYNSHIPLERITAEISSWNALEDQMVTILRIQGSENELENKKE